MRGLLRELAELRQEDRKTARLLMDRKRWEWEVERHWDEDKKRALREAKQKVCAPIWSQREIETFAQLFGGGETGREIAAFILEVQRDLPRGTLVDKVRSDLVKPSQTESNPVKPVEAGPLANPTESK